MSRSIPEKDRIRYAVLAAVYGLTDDGDQGVSTDEAAIAEHSSQSPTDVSAAVRYLNGRGLLDGVEDVVMITQLGVEEYESTRRYPDRDTLNFPAATIQQVVNQHFHGPVGASLTGSHAVAHVVQNLGASSREELLRLVTELRESVQTRKPDQTPVAIELINNVDRELRAPAPDQDALNAFAAALNAVLTGAAAQILATLIQKWVGF